MKTEIVTEDVWYSPSENKICYDKNRSTPMDLVKATLTYEKPLRAVIPDIEWGTGADGEPMLETTYAEDDMLRKFIGKRTRVTIEVIA